MRSAVESEFEGWRQVECVQNTMLGDPDDTST